VPHQKDCSTILERKKPLQPEKPNLDDGTIITVAIGEKVGIMLGQVVIDPSSILTLNRSIPGNTLVIEAEESDNE